VTWLVATVAVEIGVDPNAVLEWDPVMFDAVVDVLTRRAKESKR